MVTMERALRHTAWADDLLFAKLAELPDAALTCTYGSSDWTVAHMVRHIVDGGQWYRYVLGGGRWTDLTLPTSMAEVSGLREELRSVYDFLVAQAELDDEQVTYVDGDGPRTVLRSTILAQTTYHGTEHRTHVAVALELGGYDSIRSDDFDLWTFADVERSR